MLASGFDLISHMPIRECWGDLGYIMREIVTQRMAGSGITKTVSGTAGTTDEYVDRIIKLIPGEVVALYITLAGILAASSQNSGILFWLIFVICLAGTPLYLKKISKVNNHVQIAVSTVAFIVWVFALGGPFATMAWYQPIYGALLLPIFTFFIPMVIEK
jgi:hypothetical protein